MSVAGDFKTKLGHLADAVRFKTRMTAQMTIDEMTEAVMGISTGAGGLKEYEVRFYDYEGTLTYSYTKDAFLSMEEMPETPPHAGLTSQGWNWTLAQAQAYVTKYGMIDIGANYVTDDGKTRLYVKVKPGCETFHIGFGINGTATIDWGDGETETITGTSLTTPVWSNEHTFGYGINMITIEGGTIHFLGSSAGNSYCYIVRKYLTTGTEPRNRPYINMVHKIECGSNITGIGSNGLRDCNSMESISLSRSITTVNGNGFNYCMAVKGLVIPPGIKTINSSTFNNCTSTKAVSLPPSVTAVNSSAFSNMFAIRRVVIPEGVKSLPAQTFANNYSMSEVCLPDSVSSFGNKLFYYCYNLRNAVRPEHITISDSQYIFAYCYTLPAVTIPEELTKIGNSTFQRAFALSSITFPSNITSIGTYAFENCFARYIDFSANTAIPTLANVNAFANTQSTLEIIVPDSLYNEWVTATNWSDTSIVGHIMKVTESSKYGGAGLLTD